jgi:hypothetical protein
MDGQLISLGSAPAHIVPGGGLRLNAAVQAGIQPSFAVVKFKSKVWRIRYRGEETVLEESRGTGRDGRPLPMEPIPTIDVVVVGAAQAIAKRFYLGGYDPNAEGKAPDCFSINGITPDPASTAKQNVMCATCPKNVWGSATMDNGRKSKACSDRRRMAVVPAFDVANEAYGGPMLLDIPPASLKILESYGRQLERMGADISQVVTRIGFNPMETLELTFACVGWVVKPEDFELGVEIGQSDQVRRMLYEEVIDVTADADALAEQALLGARPAHIPARLAPAQAVMGTQPAADAAPPVASPAAPAQAPAQAQAQPQARPSPFATNRAAVGQTANTTVVTQPPPAQPAQPTVVQGAPASLEAEIDNLLNNC